MSESSSRSGDESKPRKARAPRPDQMTSETFEFVAAVDQYRRDSGKSFLQTADVLEILTLLSYVLPEEHGSAEEAYEVALTRYKEENARLFPNWSEVFGVILELGYERDPVG